MAAAKFKRILCGAPNAANQLAHLRNHLSTDGEMVSPKHKKLTQSVFGSPLSPVKVVERICNDVRERGLPAVLKYTEQLDKVKLTPQTLRVTQEELEKAHAAADPEFLDTIRRVRLNIVAFQSGLLHSDAVMTVSGSHELQVRYRPLRRVGLCIPGGAAAYPSTLLMTAVPAQAAGVPEIVVVMPPTPTGGYNSEQLAVCHELGLKEVYRVGGAQAIAALAYGIEGLPKVDKIAGPGNLFVTLAKKHVFGQVGIDCLAGPSEVVVVADASAQPDYVASDLIAQAEHSPGASILVTWHEPLLDEVTEALNRHLKQLPRGDLARESLERFGAMVLTRDKDEAAKVVEELAPEHLHIQTRDPEAFAEHISNAGAIFLGQYTPVALGDYAAGPSHVLPTGGTARFANGLSANDFLRRTSILSFTRNGLKDIAEDVVALAMAEGLTAHAASVSLRVGDNSHITPRPPKKAEKKPAAK
ncbi:MAG: histidinol dehydrogenase [Gemmataceae bacterium]